MACNNPLEVQRRIQAACAREKAKFVYWLQQFSAMELDDSLRNRGVLFETLVGTYYHSLELDLLRRSDAIVPVSHDMMAILASQWDVYERQCMVVYNWTPLDKVTVGAKDNAWSRRMGVTENKVILYAGGLSKLEEPTLLLDLAEQMTQRPDVQILVVSEGPETDRIASEVEFRKIKNLRVLPYQPYDEYSNVLASADVLFAMVSENSAALAVPSKVMSYFCAGRPIVLAAPFQNLAARQLQESGAGTVVPPFNNGQLSNAVLPFLDDVELSRETGARGRAYAERTFDISSITDRFEQLFDRLYRGPVRRRTPPPLLADKFS
jgi:glycosyltransferase involved in cell wall biosynthesis